jgi:hypothetical protein
MRTAPLGNAATSTFLPVTVVTADYDQPIRDDVGLPAAPILTLELRWEAYAKQLNKAFT